MGGIAAFVILLFVLHVIRKAKQPGDKDASSGLCSISGKKKKKPSFLSALFGKKTQEDTEDNSCDLEMPPMPPRLHAPPAFPSSGVGNMTPAFPQYPPPPPPPSGMPGGMPSGAPPPGSFAPQMPSQAPSTPGTLPFPPPSQGFAAPPVYPQAPPAASPVATDPNFTPLPPRPQ